MMILGIEPAMMIPMSSDQQHLINVDKQHRESIATLRLLDIPSFVTTLLPQIGIRWPYCWLAVEMDQGRLVEDREGDIDILAGNLLPADRGHLKRAIEEMKASYPDRPDSFHDYMGSHRLAEEGGIAWPPALEYLVGIEVKCSYFDDRPRSTKSSRKKVRGIRSQLDGYIEMGLDRVVMLDVVANRPEPNEGFGSFSVASWRAHDNRKAMHETWNARILADSPVDHFVLSLGAVEAGHEGLRGGGYPTLVHQGRTCYDPTNVRIRANRLMMDSRLLELFRTQPQPRWFPATFVDCESCRKLHWLGECKQTTTLPTA